MRRLMVALAAGMTLAFSVSAPVYQVVGPRREGPLRRPPAGRHPNRSSEDRSGRGAAWWPAAVSADRCPLPASTLSRLGLGAWLGADMGLGKTIQVLALLLVQRAEAGSQR